VQTQKLKKLAVVVIIKMKKEEIMGKLKEASKHIDWKQILVVIVGVTIADMVRDWLK
jgi:hypothetical protein